MIKLSCLFMGSWKACLVAWASDASKAAEERMKRDLMAKGCASELQGD